jgi:small subunit ribosomal protein S4
MIKQKKKYTKPRRPFDKARIEEEGRLVEKYGLKNKREIWKAESSISRIRNLAKELTTSNQEEKEIFVLKLQRKGFPVSNISEALALDKENWLKRRLQTIVLEKKLANTPKQARQFIVHKHISIGDKIINIPSYQVTLDEELHIKLDVAFKEKDKKSKIEEIREEIEEETKSGEE